METHDRAHGERTITVLAAAAALRRAARLTDPADRADAVWDGVGTLRLARAGAASIADRLEDDGSGDSGVPDSRLLIASARDLEEIVASARGVTGEGRPDPSRVRSLALRADGPTTRERTRRRHQRRRRNRGGRVP